MSLCQKKVTIIWCVICLVDIQYLWKISLGCLWEISLEYISGGLMSLDFCSKIHSSVAGLRYNYR